MTTKQAKRFLLWFYGLALAGVILLQLAQFAFDSAARASGQVQTIECTLADFETQWLDLQPNGSIDTSSEDPKLFMETLPCRVLDVQLDIAYSRHPGEVNLYYRSAGEEYDKNKKVWGTLQQDGTYLLRLPRTRIDAIRIDPTNYEHIQMTIRRITLNPPRTLADYFRVDGSAVFDFVVYTSLAAASLYTVLNMFWKELAPLFAKAKQKCPLKRKEPTCK